MSKYAKLQTIDKMLEAIPFPDDAEIYITTGDYLHSDKQMTIGIYVSSKNRTKLDEERAFGEYLSIVCATLDEAIIKISAYVEKLTATI